MEHRWLDILRRHGEPDLGAAMVALARQAVRVHREELHAGGVAPFRDAMARVRDLSRFDLSVQRPDR